MNANELNFAGSYHNGDTLISGKAAENGAIEANIASTRRGSNLAVSYQIDPKTGLALSELATLNGKKPVTPKETVQLASAIALSEKARHDQISRVATETIYGKGE